MWFKKEVVFDSKVEQVNVEDDTYEWDRDDVNLYEER